MCIELKFSRCEIVHDKLDNVLFCINSCSSCPKSDFKGIVTMDCFLNKTETL